MDGMESRKSVFLMAATNRPDIVDPAVLRPGRLDKTLYVGFPTVEDKRDILWAVTKNGRQPTLSADVDLQLIAADPRCEFFTGADLAALVREASVTALKEHLGHDTGSNRPLADAPPVGTPDHCTTVTKLQAGVVCGRHFDVAFENVKPSVSAADRLRYLRLKDRFSGERKTQKLNDNKQPDVV